MKAAFFNAVCPFEIGDKVILNSGGVNINDIRTITDIAALHSVKSGTVEFWYELDNDGRYIKFSRV